MRGYGGRPHWGKLHTPDGRDRCASAYPRFDDFLRVRDTLDPERRLANPYLERVLCDGRPGGMPRIIGGFGRTFPPQRDRADHDRPHDPRGDHDRIFERIHAASSEPSGHGGERIGREAERQPVTDDLFESLGQVLAPG